MLTAFDGEYGWVRRLLPVWRVDQADAENPAAKLDTHRECLSAAINDGGPRVGALFADAHQWDG